MRNNAVIIFISIVVVLATTAMAFTSFNRLKSAELDFNEKKALMVKEGLDLRDRIENLQYTMQKKTESIEALENEKQAIEQALNTLSQENRALRQMQQEADIRYSQVASEKNKLEQKTSELERQCGLLSRKLDELEKNPVVQKIRDAIYKEQNAEVKKVLQSALRNIELIQQGKVVELSPIIVAPDAAHGMELLPEQETGKRGRVVSSDSSNNLVVVDLGRKDGINTGDECIIIQDNQERAWGEVISVRHKMSAVYISEIAYRYSVSDIKEGDEAQINSPGL
jgi:predicted RNase H-like nuclease (RuvC/YqgF family)